MIAKVDTITKMSVQCAATMRSFVKSFYTLVLKVTALYHCQWSSEESFLLATHRI